MPSLSTPILHTILGVVVGAALGYLYHRVVGCSTGACPLTARWWTATLYGALLGGLIAR